MKRLKAYIRRTVLASATEYAYPAKRRTMESTKSAFIDASNGTDTGWWNDLIYTKDVIAMFNRYRGDCAAAIADYLDATGQNVGDTVTRDDKTTFSAMLVACAGKPITWDDYTAEDNSKRQDNAMAGTLAIRFAVEYLISDVAQECGIDL